MWYGSLNCGTIFQLNCLCLKTSEISYGQVFVTFHFKKNPEMYLDLHLRGNIFDDPGLRFSPVLGQVSPICLVVIILGGLLDHLLILTSVNQSHCLLVTQLALPEPRAPWNPVFHSPLFILSLQAYWVCTAFRARSYTHSRADSSDNSQLHAVHLLSC